MKFIETNDLSHDIVDACERKFLALVLELGVRNNNYHVGSGLGGNNFQLMVLMDYHHVLDSHNSMVLSYQDNTISWGSDWLINTSMKDIRKQLDICFSSILEDRKINAVAFEALVKSNSILESFNLYQDQFPNVKNCLQGGNYRLDKTLDLKEKLILAAIICQNLAVELDAGNTSNVDNVGTIIGEFTEEIILLAVRRYIGIERLIKFDLDEVPSWEVWINKINNAVK